jgi:hypothetical protein
MPADTPKPYTPSMKQIREDFALASYGDRWDSVPLEDSRAAFDRWLAAHDREVAERAWDEASAAFNAHFSIMGGGPTSPYRLEAGEANG